MYKYPYLGIIDDLWDLYEKYEDKEHALCAYAADGLKVLTDILYIDGDERISLERLRELVGADTDKRCMVIPKPMTVSDVEMLERIGLIVKNLADMENLMKTAEANEAAQDALNGGAK